MDTIADSIACKINRIKENIAEAEYKTGRQSGAVRLIAATKYVDIERIRQAVACGITEVGENKAQEFVEKYEFFNAEGLKKHFIGQLQKNKVKYLIGRAELIQSIGSMPLLLEADRLALKRRMVQDVLIEVNIGAEVQKAGVAPDKLPEMLKSVSDLPGIRVMGLMCIPPAGDEAAARPFFARMRELFERMKAFESPNVFMRELSMGMSGDYKTAILEGATMVRIGSAIFGARDYSMR